MSTFEGQPTVRSAAPGEWQRSGVSSGSHQARVAADEFGCGGAGGLGEDMFVDSATDDVNQAIAGELQLMDPRVRSSRERAGQLLDPEFMEVGGSGRRWTYEAMLAELPEHPGSSLDAPRFEPSDISGVLLAPGLVHLTFETMLGERRTRHSSIWRRGDGAAGWRMYYHQATRLPPDVD